jgi:hypothetical protein
MFAQKIKHVFFDEKCMPFTNKGSRAASKKRAINIK